MRRFAAAALVVPFRLPGERFVGLVAESIAQVAIAMVIRGQDTVAMID
jgi:hypothetical protein